MLQVTAGDIMTRGRYLGNFHGILFIVVQFKSRIFIDHENVSAVGRLSDSGRIKLR